MRIILGLLFSWLALTPIAAAQTTRPVQGIERVLIVSIDGLRPDLALRARMPTLRALLDRGAFTFWAFTTPSGVTLPSHTSMLTGVSVERHKVNWNDDRKQIEYPQAPTLMELAKRQGLRTGLFAGKYKFRTLARPGSIDALFLPDASKCSDADVADRAIAAIREDCPHVLFVHLPDVDTVGHAKGWGSPAHVEAIEAADLALGRLLDALRDKGLLDSTLVIVSADHGGAGLTHGPNDPRSRHIPWIAAGPGVRAGFDLARLAPVHVNTEDTFATACWILGISPPEGIDGKPVVQILEGVELIGPAPAAASAPRPAPEPATRPAPEPATRPAAQR